MRSIPVCAGEPVLNGWWFTIEKVYPRVCGGTTGGSARRNQGEGLSPCVRGNPSNQPHFTCNHGSIPVCAGEPWLWRSRIWRLRVYPRVCGGTSPRSATSSNYAGLSPCVRGNPGVAVQKLTDERSIPVCAGEPSTKGKGMKDREVYPRVCGGTKQLAAGLHGTGGLSPCVRGNHGVAAEVRGEVGSIPVCAGEPGSS